MLPKASRPPTRFEEIDEWAGGLGWLAYPDESMARASHALCIDRSDGEDAIDGETAPDGEHTPDDVWIIDPLRAPGIDDRLRALGNVVGVVVLLDRHSRDAVTFARRHDVPLYLPTWVDVGVPDDVGVVRITDRLPGTDYELIETVDLPGWHEAALYDGETLVLADALGTAAYFTTGAERIGVHPMLRLVPPRVFRGRRVTPHRVLVGHGPGIMENAGPSLKDAIRGSRRQLPRLGIETLRRVVSALSR